MMQLGTVPTLSTFKGHQEYYFLNFNFVNVEQLTFLDSKLSFFGVLDPSENRICGVGSHVKILPNKLTPLPPSPLQESLTGVLPVNLIHNWRGETWWWQRENMKKACMFPKVLVWSSYPNTTAATDGQHPFEILWWMTLFEEGDSVYYMMNYNKVRLM